MRRLLLVAVGLLGLLMLGAPPDLVRAQAPCTVPKSWGRLAGISDYSLPLGMGRTTEGIHVVIAMP